MALQRSKSAPHAIPALLPPSLPRSSSFHTMPEAAKRAPIKHEPPVAEDPFSLAGFFPSSLGEEKWAWLREDIREQDGEWKTGDEDGTTVVCGLNGELEKLTRDAIKDEDKMGVLSLEGVSVFGRSEGEDVLLSPYWSGEAVDEDSLCLALRVRRGAGAAGSRAGTGFGTLFLDGGNTGWRKTPMDSAIDEYFPIWDISPEISGSQKGIGSHE
ncbi:hypothetical protein Hypma_015636 [Hypsizygus marmoreus]|uniref:Uncharacterized protein n=1 Tax=Hypsizygus marmoreus TaxID=39966 RepID=A0A369K7I3_HYPMA|nr:hypothetical protein Hypma_015636 [Hypsizygus marmoreus]